MATDTAKIDVKNGAEKRAAPPSLFDWPRPFTDLRQELAQIARRP